MRVSMRKEFWVCFERPHKLKLKNVLKFGFWVATKKEGRALSSALLVH